MSMPALSFPKTLYRNSLHDIRTFLNSKHKEWSIFEFRGEGTGYSDSDFEGHEIHHFQFPDHQVAPFHVYNDVVTAMRDFFASHQGAAAVLHCKAGKGRSGSMACAYMILEMGKSAEEARNIFTKARMNPTSGQGISILSQRRYLDYLERWRLDGRQPLTHTVTKIIKVRLFDVRPGIQVEIGGYEKPDSNGIHHLRTVHTFKGDEIKHATEEPGVTTLTPKEPIECPIDACIQIEQRHFSTFGQVPFSIAQAWFNGHFEARAGEGTSDNTILTLDWDELDGFKGSNRRGLKVLNKLEVTFSIA